MTGRLWLALLITLWGAPAARAQFQLFLVNGGVEQPAGPVYAFGSIDTGDAAVAQFRIRNTSGLPAILNLLSVSGAGFSLTGPAIPVQLGSQASIDLTVKFLATAPGSYSATLDSVGISLLLTATALPRLTYQVNTGSALQTLGALPVDFGTVTVGSRAVLQFTVINQTAQALTVPSLAVLGANFALNGPSPSGTPLRPLQTAAFAVVFMPSATGPRNGTLTAGTHTYDLTGTGQAPPLPKATLAVVLPVALSAQQGTVTVNLDAPAPVAISGTVNLTFQPQTPNATDPTIGFASGGRTANFTIAPGDSKATLAFQTGTTAGILTFSLQIDGATSQQTATVGPAVVGISAVQGSRRGSTITVQITGFDNTRTAGRLIFTFYDAGGNTVSPGAINADGSGAFSSYFAGSGLGGLFALTAVFPVNGGTPTQITAFDVQLINSAGTAHTARTSF